MMGKSKRRSKRDSRRKERDLNEEMMTEMLVEARQEERMAEKLPEPTQDAPRPVNPSSPRPLPLSLADIRTEALKQRSNTAHAIADLEAWRAEIDSTIAFLKSK